MKPVVIFISLLVLVGCSSTPPNVNPADPPVRYVQYVQVATYDTTLRTPTSKLNIVRESPAKKFRVIATLTINGEADMEGKLINALAWKARQLGADSILILPPQHPHRNQWIFRADVIVMDSE